MSGYVVDMAIVLAAVWALWGFHVWQVRRVERRDLVLTNLRRRVRDGGSKSWHPTRKNDPDRVAARRVVEPPTEQRKA